LRLESIGLTCSRGPSVLFRDVSFRIERGEWTAVRGPNGSGKTTLLRCVAGLTRADAGRVEREGRLAYAGHLPAIKDDLSAEENLRGALALASSSARPGEIRAALEAVGLSARRALPSRRLSAGQRRRIGLARLMLDPSPIWVLDEPLTALDDDGQQLLARTLEKHLERGGLALVATHHDLAIAPSRVLALGGRA